MNISNLLKKLLPIKNIELNELRPEVSAAVTAEDAAWKPCHCLGYLAMHRTTEYLCAYDEYNRPVEIVGGYNQHRLLTDKEHFEITV